MKKNDGNDKGESNRFVTKLFQLISIMARSKAPLRLQEIAIQSEMPQATALRYLKGLIDEGFAFQDEQSGRYLLSWKICGISDEVRARLGLRTLCGNLISELSMALDSGICLVVEQDMECMYLDCVYEPTGMERSLQRIGKQTPLHSTGSGKILLTEYSEADIDNLIRLRGLAALTSKTITDKETLLAELAKVRENGYALDDEECEEGLRCVSAPIYDYSERVAAAVSAFGSAEKLTDRYINETVLPALKKTAVEASLRLGFDSKG